MKLKPLTLVAPRSIAPLVEQAMDLCDSIEEKAIVGLVGHHSLSAQDLRRFLRRHVVQETPEEGIIETMNRLGMPVHLRITGETWQALRHVLRNHPLREHPDAPVFLRRKLVPQARALLERGVCPDARLISRSDNAFRDAFRRLALRIASEGRFFWPWERRHERSLDLFMRSRRAWKDGPLMHARDRNSD